jgi:hypothetical protein
MDRRCAYGGAAHRSRASGINGDVRAAGQFDEAARIPFGDGERQIPGYGDEAEHFQLGRGERQQNRHRVVDAGIGVDDDPPRHAHIAPVWLFRPGG